MMPYLNESDIMPCIKIDKPVDYLHILGRNVMQV